MKPKHFCTETAIALATIISTPTQDDQDHQYSDLGFDRDLGRDAVACPPELRPAFVD